MKTFLRVLTVSLALAVIVSPPAALAGDKKKKKQPVSEEVRALTEEIQHTRAMANHVQDEVNAGGSNKEIRAVLAHVYAEMNHIDDELNTGYVEVKHMRAELEHIHEELHQVEEDIHARGARRAQEDQSDRGTYIRVR